MADPLILYSVNSWLAYIINERYYGGEHFVWCAPVFDVEAQSRFEQTLPPTSSPRHVYRRYREEVERADRHGPTIAENKTGILRGAIAQRQAGIINEDQQKEITVIVNAAERTEFRPLLYLIPYAFVAGLVAEVPVERRAAPLSREFLIARLPRRCFDVIEF
jgi:hypothetical protein